MNFVWIFLTFLIPGDSPSDCGQLHWLSTCSGQWCQPQWCQSCHLSRCEPLTVLCVQKIHRTSFCDCTWILSSILHFPIFRNDFLLRTAHASTAPFFSFPPLVNISPTTTFPPTSPFINGSVSVLRLSDPPAQDWKARTQCSRVQKKSHGKGRLGGANN